MGLRLYNTLSRTLEDFEPLHPPRVTMYTCGPTVWNFAHIGNFRTFLFEDLLRRYLEYLGFEVFQVMNLTDVDDRTIKAALAGGRRLQDHTAAYVDAFFEDCRYLRIKPADVYPRATAHVDSMIELVQDLLGRGYAYEGDDGSVYFSVDKFESYGRLSQLERRELRAGSRVASDEYAKEDARDFALWKSATPDDEEVGAAWDAPFGRGRPGWHLECSAIALSEIRTRFGVDTLDIHAGGVDLIFPHHENEIAQSEGATGQPFARYWLHGEFLTMDGTKMSKRYGNTLTARDLREEGVDAAAVRMLAYSTHYRQQLNFTDGALDAASEGVKRVGEFVTRLREIGQGGDSKVDPPAAAVEFEAAFRGRLDDDLNAPQAVGALFSFIRVANRELDRGRWTAEEVHAVEGVVDRIMGVIDLVPTPTAVADEFRQWVEACIAEREAARAARDFPRADAIRADLAERGVDIEDTPQGTRWKLRGGAESPGGPNPRHSKS